MIKLKNKKAMFDKKNQQEMNSSNSSSEKPLEVSEQSLRDLFNNNGDIKFEKHTFGNSSFLQVLLVYCEGMVNSELINQSIINRLENFINEHGNQNLTDKMVEERLHIPNISIIKDTESIVKDLFSGKMLIHFAGFHFAFTIDISKRPQRSPEETVTEVTIKGPRDNFIEDLAINIALIRKRLRTTSLHIQKFEIGRRSSTAVSLLYIADIANKDIVDGISRRLENVDTDGIFSGDQLLELIEKPTPFFPRHHYTGRPDFAVHCLLKGRCIILIDGIAYSIILPANLFFLLKTGEDYEALSTFSSIERILRVASIFIAIFMPGFWIALTTYHQDELPSILLANVVSSRQGLPFPSALEAFLMLFLFELFREAGLRMPSPIGSTLSVFGALIIGDAAIRAGLTSPSQVVVMSTSLIATFTIPNQSLAGSVSLLRIITLLLSAFIGLYGFFIAYYLIITYACSIRSFGVPYIGISANISFSNIINTVLRMPAKLANKERPQMFYPKDPTSSGGDSNSK
jgi:spore germination protein KA